MLHVLFVVCMAGSSSLFAAAASSYTGGSHTSYLVQNGEKLGYPGKALMLDRPIIVKNNAVPTSIYKGCIHINDKPWRVEGVQELGKERYIIFVSAPITVAAGALLKIPRGALLFLEEKSLLIQENDAQIEVGPGGSIRDQNGYLVRN